MLGVNILHKTINQNDNAFDLKGMINPTFQNLGDSPVLVNGTLLENGDSYPVLTNGLELQNKISIAFTSDTDTKQLSVNYLMHTAIEPKCS